MQAQLRVASVSSTLLCPVAPARCRASVSFVKPASKTPTRIIAQARRRPSWEFEETSHDTSDVVQEATSTSNGLFGDAFKSVLSETLARQGSQSLLQGSEKLVDEHNISNQEEVLKSAIMAAKSTLLKLNLVKNEVDKAIETETKQVERLIFALNKARSDAAYYRSLGRMMEDGRSD